MEPRIAFYVCVRGVYTKTDHFRSQGQAAPTRPLLEFVVFPSAPMVRSFFPKNILIKIAKKRCITYIATV
jgi:hypothetical protein